ncbi:MAG TPA: RNA-binding S4 domain-containing protein [Candidatus Aquicultor sp.]|jgi:ribosome-associated protein
MRNITVTPGTKLEQLLKLADLVGSGGEAKLEIQDGAVAVNGKTELRRGYKVKDGDIVTIDGESIEVSIQQ